MSCKRRYSISKVAMTSCNVAITNLIVIVTSFGYCARKNESDPNLMLFRQFRSIIEI